MLPCVDRGGVLLWGNRQQNGFGSVLEQGCSVLSLALLHPVSIDLEGTGVDELADGLDCVRVALYHIFGHRLGAAVVAIDSHGGQHSHAYDLKKQGHSQKCVSPKEWCLDNMRSTKPLSNQPWHQNNMFPHLKLPVRTEVTNFCHHILLEEWMVQCIRSCVSLLWVHHQHPRDLDRSTNKRQAVLLVTVPHSHILTEWLPCKEPFPLLSCIQATTDQRMLMTFRDEGR